MKKTSKKLLVLRGRKERGYTLLEYCAGAAVILGVVLSALNAMGSGINALMTGIGAWATERATEVGSTGGGSSSDGGH